MPDIPEVRLDTASELWDQLSSTQRQSNSDNQVIYRGHANAKWELKPTFLRQESLQLQQELWSFRITCEKLAWIEFRRLRHFLRCCDENGVEVPNDSLELRNSVFSDENFRSYHEFPSTWPPDGFLEIMAFGRLHGLATRLLDWSTNPYVAAYFAASEALLSQDDWVPGQRTAIFALNFEPEDTMDDITYLGRVRLLQIRGSISPNIVVQQGMFTLHPLVGNKNEMAEVKSLEKYLSPRPESPIAMYTIPVCQVLELYKLCDIFGYNVARLFPGPEGAVRAMRESDMYRLAKKNRQG